jgi:hypothetical protein
MFFGEILPIKLSQESLFFYFLLIRLAPENHKKQEKGWIYFSAFFLCRVGSWMKTFGIQIWDLE